MKRAILFSVIVLFYTTASYCNPVSFSKLIEAVPIDSTIVGTPNLCELDSFRYDFNYPTFFAWDTDKDIENRYRLNDYFDYDTLKDQLKYKYSLLREHGAFIFAKRLPKVGNHELLLYYIERFTSAFPNEKFPQWALLSIDGEGNVVKAFVVAEVDCQDNDNIIQKLFQVRNDGFLIKIFSAPWEDDPEWYNYEYLYCRDTKIVPFTDL